MRRRLLRWIGWPIAALLGVLLLPSAVIETACRPQGSPAPARPLASETRPEARTLLTYPEWHIVHAYADYAQVIATDDPHEFGYLRAVWGYWSGLCRLSRTSGTLGPVDGATRQLVHVIGASFTFEMAMKGAYEETFGRVATWIRGNRRARLDALSAQQAAAYAAFLQQTPWYSYDFRADAATLSAAATDGFRDRERAVALGLEHLLRAQYADVIGRAVVNQGGDDLSLQMVLSGLQPGQIEAVEGVTILGPAAGGRGTEVETPRYRALTHILQDWADQGAEFHDIAGNDQILITVLSQTEEVPGALASFRRQGYGDWRHLILVAVPDLAATLRALPGLSLRLEHIHDY